MTIYRKQSANLETPSDKFVKVTKANEDLDDVTKALLVGTAGTANLMDGSGEVRTDVPLIQGYNPLRVKQVRTGGTADDIWALY
jgi:hypothetical protein